MDSPIILIGPLMAGKSTIAQLLSEQLGIPRRELDHLRWDYYKEIGYDESLAQELGSKAGFPALYRYGKPFEAYAVERVLADFSEGVIDFGAGNSVYEDPELFGRVQRALAPYENVILLIPCADLDEAVKILTDRFIEGVKARGLAVDPQGLWVVEHFIRHPSSRQLAKWVVYTDGKTPEETCAEIIQKLTMNSSAA